MTSLEKIFFSLSHGCENAVKGYIEFWFNSEDLKRAVKHIRHVSIQEAYKQILHELFTMDDRFYAALNARNLKRCSTGKDWREFAVPELIKMLDIIYWTRNYNELSNDESVDDDYSETDEQAGWVKSYTKSNYIIRKSCANFIWSAWAYERLWGPRYGVILISIMEASAEKVLLISHIKGNVLHFGFPKGKPNIGETIRMGGFREFKEETGVNDLTWNLQIDEEDGLVIEKNPYIGPIDRRRSRAHYYVITTTSGQFTAFQPNRQEVLDVEWHSIYTLPCSDHCEIRQKCRYIKGSTVPINYHMVTLEDINKKNSVVWDLLECIKNNGNPDAHMKYLHTHRRCENNAS